MQENIRLYLSEIESKFKTGKATEHTYRNALQTLIDSIDKNIEAINEPKREACGAPDYAVIRKNVTCGYIEAKDLHISLDEVERSKQLKRYFEALPNLIITNYLEFRWFVEGEHRETVRLARLEPSGNLTVNKTVLENLKNLLKSFIEQNPPTIATPKELAERMSRITHIIRDIIVKAFENNIASELLKGMRQAFAQTLISDLAKPEKIPEFADMFAQTLTYGLFTARIMDRSLETFTREKAQKLIPKSNPL